MARYTNKWLTSPSQSVSIQKPTSFDVRSVLERIDYVTREHEVQSALTIGTHRDSSHVPDTTACSLNYTLPGVGERAAGIQNHGQTSAK